MARSTSTSNRRAPATRRSSSRAGVTQRNYHLVIEAVTPAVDAGRYAAKRVIGRICDVSADIYKDGHDLIRARVRYRRPDGSEDVAPLVFDDNHDRWFGGFELDQLGRWTFQVEAWTDVFGTWLRGLGKKAEAGQDVSLELLEGSELLERAARRVRDKEQRAAHIAYARKLADAEVAMSERVLAAQAPEVLAFVEGHLAPEDLTTSDRWFPVDVDRERAAFASWYELFPRSESGDPARHGTFRDAEARLPALAELGFDVIYLPPIHPIGRTFRKGRNNTLTPESTDVGSPWAIGSEDGGHTEVHPELGTLADFERFVQRAQSLGMEVALDFALQCSPDHPWVREHPDWFKIRPDGSIQYAENPPKKYQDIYPLNFWCDDRENLWNACRDAMLFWAERGVRTFRVDNPHTKPMAFWEWAIAEVRRQYPDTVFLSEAFTRPKKLLNLAKLGFTQSYTYFTWKNEVWELEQWMTEFSQPDVLEYYRGNLFANTPDILHEYLQRGGRPAFRIRLLLAATLSPLYGIYSGFELAENVAVKPGSEEYLDSEKYEIRVRDYDAPGNLNEDIRQLNRIRRAQPALQRADNLRFIRSENPNIIAYWKEGRDGGDDLLILVTVDPARVQEGFVSLPLEAMGLSTHGSFQVEDLLSGETYTWWGERNYVRLDPAFRPGHILRVIGPGTLER